MDPWQYPHQSGALLEGNKTGHSRSYLPLSVYNGSFINQLIDLPE